MKPGSENRKKTIMAGGLGAVALCCLFYLYNTLFGGPSTVPPAPVVTPATANAPVKIASTANNAAATAINASSAPAGNRQNAPAAIPGVAANVVATTSSSLDPALDQVAMLRTENLVYGGSGRNIFSALYVAPVAKMKPPPAPPPRPVPIPTPVPTGPPPPPPPPPINLKFFGTATRGNGQKQAFLLSGEDVYLASEGDIVARKYKIVSISTGSIRVTDLSNNNTQTLPQSN